MHAIAEYFLGLLHLLFVIHFHNQVTPADMPPEKCSANVKPRKRAGIIDGPVPGPSGGPAEVGGPGVAFAMLTGAAWLARPLASFAGCVDMSWQTLPVDRVVRKVPRAPNPMRYLAV